MNIKIVEEPYYPRECAILLSRMLAAEDSFPETGKFSHLDTFFKKIEREYPSRLSKITDLLVPYRTVSEYVWNHMTVPQERLQFYFSSLPESQLIPGHILVSMDRTSIDAATLPPEQRHPVIASFLQNCFVMNEKAVTPPDEAGLMEWLDRQPVSAQDKWNCMMLYQRTEEFQRECRGILSEAERLYREQRPVWESAIGNTVLRLRCHIEEKGIGYLAEHFHIQNNSDNLVIYPSLSGFNMLSLTNFEYPDCRLISTDFLDVGYATEEIMASSDLDSSEIEPLNLQLKALGDRRRLEILTILRQGPLCGQEIADKVGLTPATVSHHMNELINRSFVTIVKEGTRINYLYSPEGMEALLRHLRRQFPEK